MKYFLLGLGNPGGEYENTRHNVGREAVSDFTEANNFSLSKGSDKSKESKGNIENHKVASILPEVYMNQSGKALLPYIKGVKDAEGLIVVHDDIDLPFGRIKISFGRSSGGHRGVESIIKSIKTKDFVRIRVGVSPATSSGKLKKPSGEEKVIKFIMGKFKPSEEKELKKVKKKIAEAIETIIKEGREKAMGQFN